MKEVGSLGPLSHNSSFKAVPQSEPGKGQDHRSCTTRAFKWVVCHPFLAAAGTIGLVALLSGTIYGVTFAVAAAALSERNVIGIAPNQTTKASDVTTKAQDNTYKLVDATTIITIPLTKMESAISKFSGFIAGEGTQGVSRKLQSEKDLRTKFSVNLLGSDGNSYSVNLIGRQNFSGCKKQKSVALTNYSELCNNNTVLPDSFTIKFLKNNHLPASLSYNGSFTLNRIELGGGSASESYRFNISLPSTTS